MSNVRREDIGDFTVGSTAVVTQPRLGTGRWTVTECTPLRSFAWVVSRPGITTTGIHLLEPTPDGVKVTQTPSSIAGPWQQSWRCSPHQRHAATFRWRRLASSVKARGASSI